MFKEAQRGRLLFFTGLPASGKSILLRKQISMAVSVGHRVHIFHWDTGLSAFATDEILAKHPDIEDGSHPIIRLAAGHWGRPAIARWIEEHPDPADILIGEVPIIGNRYSEFIAVRQDAIEPVMKFKTTKFFYPGLGAAVLCIAARSTSVNNQAVAHSPGPTSAVGVSRLHCARQSRRSLQAQKSKDLRTHISGTKQPLSFVRQMSALSNES